MEMLISRGAMRRMLTGLAAACLLGGAALAAPGHHLTVKYSDLNLGTEAGANVLYARIKGAARFVCGDEGQTLFEQRLFKQCYRRSIEDAAARVNSPLLTTLVQGDRAAPPTAALVR